MARAAQARSLRLFRVCVYLMSLSPLSSLLPPMLSHGCRWGLLGHREEWKVEVVHRPGGPRGGHHGWFPFIPAVELHALVEAEAVFLLESNDVPAAISRKSTNSTLKMVLHSSYKSIFRNQANGYVQRAVMRQTVAGGSNRGGGCSETMKSLFHDEKLETEKGDSDM